MSAPPLNEPYPPPPPAAPFVLGILAERYELLGELGHGGMAAVYHARERAAAPGAAAGREVAIKVVRSRDAGDPEALRRFAAEATTMAGLDHPNIVRTLAIEEFGGEAVAIVTAYVRGRTLREALSAAGGPLPFDAAAGVLRDLGAALAYAHARRLVHRDVKPENTFLETPSGRVLLADFGIARQLDADPALTVHGAALGTPTYMAPEQIAGGLVDERSDVYALALVGWEMLAGWRPWQGETLYTLLHKQQFEPLPDLAALRPDIPAYLLDAIRGGLAKDPAGRWRDGAEFLERLTPRPQAFPGAWPVPAASTDPVVTPADNTVRVPTPVSGRNAVPGVVFEDAHTVPAPGPRAGGPRRARRVRGAVIGVGLAAAALVGGLVARSRAAERTREADAAATGVTDAELAELLRAANAAAQGPGARAPATGSATGEVSRAAPSPPATRGSPPPRTARAARPAPPRANRPSAAGSPGAGRRAAAPESAAGPAPEIADAEPDEPEATLVAAPVAPAVAAPVAAAAATTGDRRCRSAASADQRACLMAALDRQDDGLTRSYQGLIAVLRRQAGGAAEPPTVRALRAEQRAWVDARDRQCRAALAGREGTYWGAARAPCFAALSARRAREFAARRARLVDRGGAAEDG